MSALDDDLQPRTTNPLAPAQTAIRYCLADIDGFLNWAEATYGGGDYDYPPGFFADRAATEADLTECHNHIGELIDGEMS